METETVNPIEIVPEVVLPLAEIAPPEPTPVLAYSSPTTLTPGPTALEVLGTGFGLTLAIIALAGAGLFLFWILQLGMDGYEFGSLALLAPVALFLIAARRAIRFAGRNLPGFRAAADLRGEEALRQWRDVPGGILSILFGLTLIAILLFVIRDLLQDDNSPKKIVATMMIVIVLLYGISRTFQSVCRQLGAAAWIKRAFPKSSQEENHV